MKNQRKIESELEEKFGKLLIKSFSEYYGGYKRKIAGGILSPHNVGMMYIFRDHFVFKADVAQKGNYWEIVIPIRSIIVDNWSYDTSSPKKLLKDGTRVEKISGKDHLIIPYLDDDGVVQRPEFGITRTLATNFAVGAASYFRGGGIKKVWEVLYNIITETHRDKLQTQSSKQMRNENGQQFDVKQWIEDGEGPTLDFKAKEILSDGFKIARAMVAFSNNKFVPEDFGGRLVIGINDKKEVIGVDYNQKHEEYIMTIAQNKCDPPISPDFKRITFENKTLYVITIPKMTTSPHRLKTDQGMIHLVRVGSTIQEPDQIHLAKLFNDLSAKSIENSRQNQMLSDLQNSFENIKSMMQSLEGLAKSKDLMIAQNRELLDKKNNKIDETLKIVQNSLTVVDKELKSKLITILHIARSRPAYEAMEHSAVLTRQRKMLENGWSKDAVDYNVNTRMADNGVFDVIVELDSVIQRLDSIRTILK